MEIDPDKKAVNSTNPTASELQTERVSKLHKIEIRKELSVLQETETFQDRLVDLEFKNIKYEISIYTLTKFGKGLISQTKKEILHGVNGSFKSGEMTSIMGPSGAGKSSLLNILAGYITKGTSGSITANGMERSLKNINKFQRLSRYIQQKEELSPYLTVEECMILATHLKLGYSTSSTEKNTKIQEIILTLGLEKCYKHLIKNLSGGERKRLAIALELLSDPSILFLDEPTTGLDSSSSFQCIAFLKKLCQKGMTVICTIHQPSAALLENFDKLFTLADGYCIYNGPNNQLVSFLKNQGYVCPPFHTPMDFLIEIVSGIDKENLKMMSNAASTFGKETKTYLIKKALVQIDNKNKNGEKIDDEIVDLLNLYRDEEIVLESSHSTEKILPLPNFFQQTWLLFKNNITISSRNYSLYLLRLFAHISLGFLFGLLYVDVGNDAEKVTANFVYLYGSSLMVAYTGQMSVSLFFPMDMEVLKQQHFNKWYDIGPFFLSSLSFELPFQILCCCTYVSASFILTDNNVDYFRTVLFFTFIILNSLCGQAFGYFIGSVLSIRIGVFIGPILMAILSMFGFCISYVDTNYLFRWLFYVSYFRSGYQSLLYTMYGMGRRNLNCFNTETYYCHYRTASKVLKYIDAENINILGNLCYMIAVGILFHSLTISSLWYKLNRR